MITLFNEPAPVRQSELMLTCLYAFKWFVWRQERGMVLSRLTAAVFREIIRAVEDTLGTAYDDDEPRPWDGLDPAAYDARVKAWFNEHAVEVGERALGPEYFRHYGP